MGRARLLTALIDATPGSSLETRMTTAEAEIDVLQAAASSLQSAVNAVDIKATGAVTAANNAQASVAGVVNRPTIFASTTENFMAVPITDGATENSYVMYSVFVNEVKAGDKFMAFAHGMLRSDYSEDTECTARLTWSVPPANPLTGTLPGHNAMAFNNANQYANIGRNVNQEDEHYFDWCRTGIYQFQSNYAQVMFGAVLRARSTATAGGVMLVSGGGGNGGLAVIKLN